VKYPCSYCEHEAKHIVSGTIDAGGGDVRVRPAGDSAPFARKR
jgi:hypothetical protein